MIVKTINYYKIKKQELLCNPENVLEFSERSNANLVNIKTQSYARQINFYSFNFINHLLSQLLFNIY